MKIKLLILILIFVGAGGYYYLHTDAEYKAPASYSGVNTIIHKPTGSTYKKIDVTEQNETYRQITGDDETISQKAVNKVLGDINSYNPVVVSALSAYVFDSGKKDEGAFLFYVAQLRARYDANLCLDVSARSGTGILNMRFGPAINEYTFQDKEKLKVIVDRAILFVEENEETYDHRWLSLHGMSAFGVGSEDVIAPKEEWPTIKVNTINTYKSEFEEVLASLE